MKREKPPARALKPASMAHPGAKPEGKVWIKRFGKNAGKPSGRAGRPDVSAAALPEGMVRLYGIHVVKAALDNPKRRKARLVATRNALIRLGLDSPEALPFPVEVVEPRALDPLVGADAVHQGAVLDCDVLKTRPLKALDNEPLVLVLDQVTDPHNVGALIRSAVAFNVRVLITTMRHSPDETGVMAKAASGALEHIEHIAVRNLGEAIEALNAQGYQTVGLDSDGPAPLEDTLHGNRIALVLGAEGKGLRRKTRSLTGALARLDMPGAIRSLNVSNAGAIALYVARRHLAGVQ
ncbi:MAG: RNA methyltransferase [Rhizobiaceae bacterium]|jgi:23S rRNA (guanosine2251-2'-O)-methyltransferase|nr:RNA methyltransferase [Rhizobiaceae bacterium]